MRKSTLIIVATVGIILIALILVQIEPFQVHELASDEIPLVVSVIGLRFEGTREGVIEEILREIQSRAPQNIRLVLVNDEEQARKLTSYAIFSVNYSEEPAGVYYLDSEGNYRLSKVNDGKYVGTRITCSIQVEGERQWAESLGGYDREFSAQQISLSAVTNESVPAQAGKDPERQLRDDAVANLWGQFKQMPGYVSSAVNASEQLELGPFKIKEIATGGGGFGGWTIWSDPFHRPEAIGGSSYNVVSFVDVVGNIAYLFYNDLNNGKIHCYGVDTVTGSMWEFSAPSPGGFLDVPYIPMIVRDETVYVFADRVYALEAITGGKKWETNSTYSTRSSVSLISIDDNSLYLGLNSISVVARDTGQLKWKTDRICEAQPILRGGYIYVWGGYFPDTRQIFVLDAGTGQEIRRVNVDFKGITVTDEAVYVVTNDGYFDSYDPSQFHTLKQKLIAYDETLEQKWQVALPTTDEMELAISKGYSWSYEVVVSNRGIVVVNDGYCVTAFDSGTGKSIWQVEKRLKGAFIASSVTENTVLIEDGGLLRALDLATGKERWVFQVDREVINGTSYSWQPPRNDKASNGLVYTFYDQGYQKGGLCCLDEQTGHVIWGLSLADCWYEDGIVYGFSGAGLTVVDAQTGQIEWYYPINTRPPNFDTIVKVLNGTVYMMRNGKIIIHMTAPMDLVSQPYGVYFSVIKTGATPINVSYPTFSIDDAIRQGLLTVQITGLPSSNASFGESMKITLTRTVPHPIKIVIPKGLMFKSNNSSIGDMVFCRALKNKATVLASGQLGIEVVPALELILDDNNWNDFTIEAYRVELNKQGVNEEATFSIGTLCAPQVLDILNAADRISKEEISHVAIQIAILSVTIDVNRVELQEKIPVSEQDIRQAINILQLAGINPEGKRLLGG